MFLRPSSADRWLTCPASITREKDAPETTSEAAEQGTAAHWVAEQTLYGVELKAGTMAPNDIEIDDDMITAAFDYCDYILRYADHVDDLDVERELYMPIVYDGLKGVSDCILYDEKTLDIFDYKYGYRLVDPLFNPQLELYAIGAINHYGIMDREMVVRLHIYQPRVYHPAGPGRVYETTVGKLLDKALVYRMMIEDALSNGTDKYHTGEHCTYCAARPDCSAFVIACLNAVDYVGTISEDEFNSEYLATIIHNLQIGKKRVEAMLTTLEETAIARIKNGEPVSGYALGSGRPSKVWNIEPDQVIAVGAMLDADFRKAGTLTPIQASKLVDDEVIKDYIKTKPGSAKLIKDDQTLARMAFKPLK